MTLPSILFVGQSHMTALERAHQVREEAGLASARPTYLQLRQPGFKMDLKQAPDSPAIWAAPARDLLSQVQPDFIVSCIAGNTHTMLGLVEQSRPFDFILDSAPDLPLDESREILPCKLVEDLLERWMYLAFQTSRALRHWATVPVLHVNAPPPISSAEFIEAHPSQFRERLKQFGLTPSPVRQKLWRLQSSITERLCKELGFVFVPVPPQAQDSDGGLTAAARSVDPSHGNTWYGEQVWRQIDGLIQQGVRASRRFVGDKPSPASSRHGYTGQPDHCNWRLAVADPQPGTVDPVVGFPFRIKAQERVATAGSCFAQHISRYLVECGMNYFVTELAHPLLPENLARQFNYGTFSARYGNLYTPRQLLQLFERAYGRFEPVDSAWQEDNGRWLDPYRPQIQPTGFASQRELEIDRGLHLAAVRRMFEQLDVFVFTLGLTEAWLSAVDGAVYPTCPGAAGGRFDPAVHRFHNFSVDEIGADLLAFIDALRSVNPRAKVMLTVSPVPLIATASGQHVLTATTYSKAVLRVACEQVARQRPETGYFPSYEVVAGSHARGAYFAPDLRSVTEAGVQHVMRLFMWHCVDADSEPLDAPPASQAAAQMAENQRLVELMCDEEVLDRRPPRAQ